MKKAITLAWACLLLTGTSFAQTSHGGGQQQASTTAANNIRNYKIKLGNGKEKQVQLSMFNSDVEIIGHTSDEVVIETRDYNAPPQRAEGLKPLYNQMEDNTSLGLSVEKRGDILTIAKASRSDAKYTIRVPRNASILYKETNWTGGDLRISDLDGEIEARLNNAEATFTNVSGPVVANTTAGMLKVVFSSLAQSKPSALSSVAGEIDITLPANTKANFKLKSLQGEVYTDFNMDLKKEGKEDYMNLIGGGGNIDGKTNGGGVEMSVQSISSDIFIRKKK
ncbi:DUF4097 family beta strand repeat-containing protein [Rufibacter immobilis]|uniref:DUF4097 family beta strand repeat-containing protein n=1 Tax=Rufibacter immobilis TaxID=1348778 RepID=UPI0035ECE1F9